MSQDPNLFSAFKRPRETLGVVDRNSLYGSNIPQPSSALKRSNPNVGTAPRTSVLHHRQSILPARAPNTIQRVSSGGNLVEMNTMSNRRESRIGFPSSTSARKSYAPPAQPNLGIDNRRSSMYSRLSSGNAISMGAGGSFFTTTGGTTIAGVKAQDPRPIKDRTYQAQIAQQLIDYLIKNNFELEQKHSLGPNAMRSPTQKDFMAMFQWLYHRLDPNYNFFIGLPRGTESAAPPKFDTQVITILKNLKYPYEKSLPKAQLSAAGGPHWPFFMAMLHWMMELAQALDDYDSGEFDVAAEEAGFDVSASKIAYSYVISHYKEWQQGIDDPQEPFLDMKAAFEERSKDIRDQVNILERENEELKGQLHEFGELPLAEAKKRLEIIQKDCEKFKAFTSAITERLPRLTETNARLRDELTKTIEGNEKLEEEKRFLQESVDKQGLLPADIDRMNSEREKLVKGLEGTATKLEEAHGIAAEREADAMKKLELLEHAVKRFNELAYKITPTEGINGKTYDLEISPLTRAAQNATEGSSGDDERLLYDIGIGYTPQQVLNVDIRHEVKPALNKYRSEVAAKIHTAQDESIRNQDYLERVKEALRDKAEEVETLEAKVAATNDEYNEIKETSAAENSASNVEIEKLERELQSMRINAQNGHLAVEQRLQSVKIERDQIEHAILQLREYFHGEVVKVVEEVVKFKVHVQSKLGDLDDEVANEHDAFKAELDALKKAGLSIALN